MIWNGFGGENKQRIKLIKRICIFVWFIFVFCLIINPIYHNADYLKNGLVVIWLRKIKFSEKNTHNYILIDIFAVE